MLLATIQLQGDMNAMLLPLGIGAVCIVASIIGTFFVRLGASNNIMGALYKGFIATAVISAIAIYFLIDHVFAGSDVGMNYFICAMVGLVVTGLMVWITEYYTSTSFRPVKVVAKASETGHGTNVISGLAMSMEATLSLPLSFPQALLCLMSMLIFMALVLRPQPCLRLPEWLLRLMHMARLPITLAVLQKWQNWMTRS